MPEGSFVSHPHDPKCRRSISMRANPFRLAASANQDTRDEVNNEKESLICYDFIQVNGSAKSAKCIYKKVTS